MATIKQIDQMLEESTSLKLIAQAYTEIAAAKLQKIRAGIEKNRTFFQEINEMLHIVNTAAYQRHIKLPYNKQGTVSVLLTSNHRFCGNIENKLIRFFMVNTTKFKTDRLVVGKTAQQYLNTIGYFHSFSTFTFKEDLPTYEELKNFVSTLLNYQQISVYYSRMESIMVQEPHVVDIVQKPSERYIAAKGANPVYIFEPELEKILQFFESQVTTILLEQTIFESELARTASRLTSMDQAQINAESFIKNQKIKLGRAKNSSQNMKLLETVASLIELRKGE